MPSRRPRSHLRESTSLSTGRCPGDEVSKNGSFHHPEDKQTKRASVGIFNPANRWWNCKKISRRYGLPGWLFRDIAALQPCACGISEPLSDFISPLLHRVSLGTPPQSQLPLHDVNMNTAGNSQGFCFPFLGAFPNSGGWDAQLFCLLYSYEDADAIMSSSQTTHFP